MNQSWLIIRELGHQRLARIVSSAPDAPPLFYQIEERKAGKNWEPVKGTTLTPRVAYAFAEGILDDLGDPLEEEAAPAIDLPLLPRAPETSAPFPGLDLPAGFDSFAPPPVEDQRAITRRVLAINASLLAHQIKEDIPGSDVVAGAVTDALDMIEEMERQMDDRDAARAISEGKRFVSKKDIRDALTAIGARWGCGEPDVEVEFQVGRERMTHKRLADQLIAALFA